VLPLTCETSSGGVASGYSTLSITITLQQTYATYSFVPMNATPAWGFSASLPFPVCSVCIVIVLMTRLQQFYLNPLRPLPTPTPFHPPFGFLFVVTSSQRC
jgi:hypothetical protein